MFKWDKISWIASVIFVAGIILGIINNSFLALLVVAYLLRPTILAFGGGKKYADERQTEIQFQSGNIALTVVIVAIFIFSLIDELEGKPSDTYNSILCIALLAKAIVGLVMLRDYKIAGFRTGLFFGLLLSLFILFGTGFQPIGFLVACPCFILMYISYVGLKKPMLASIVFGIVGLAAGIFRSVFFPKVNIPMKEHIATIVLLSVPLLVTAFFFYKAARNEQVEVAEF